MGFKMFCSIMYKIIHFLLGISEEVDDFEGTDVDKANVVLFAMEEEKEIEGVITDLFDDYGLINHNIVFKFDCYSGIQTAKVGDEIVAVCSKKHRNEMWKAHRVFKRKNCWDESSDESEAENNDDKWEDKRRENYENLMKLKEKLKAKKNDEIKEMEALLKEKLGVEVESGDFGKLNLGDCKLLKIVLRNNGSEAQLLENISLSKKATQFEITVFNLDSLDTKNQSRKFQESLPIVLSPSSVLHVSVLCNGQYVGKDSQFIIFRFENFKIGRELLVEVVRDMDVLLAPDSTNKDCGKDHMEMYNNVDQLLIPAPKYQYYKAESDTTNPPKGRAPHIRLPHFNVPPSLFRGIDDGDDVTRIIPCLQKALNINTYKARFQALLHLEEISQMIGLKRYNMPNVKMTREGDYLFLKVPGLAEGRPSIILGDAVKVVEKSCDGGYAHGPSYEGSVQAVLLEGVYLLFSSEFHQKFLEDLTYQVSFTLNRGVFRRCHLAVVSVPQRKHQVLFPKYIEMKKPQFNLKTCTTNEEYLASVKFINPSLNLRQKLAVTRVLHAQSRPLPYIIYGPPGTGKTVTMVEAILQTMMRGGCPILVCAPSNSATDLLAERLYKSGLVSKNSIVRLYAMSRSEESRLESLAPISDSISHDFELQSKKIVVCTCITAAGLYKLNKKEFDRKKTRGSWAPKAGSADTMMMFRHVFIDEAGQAQEPECIIPVGLAEDDGQVVLAGDPEQLGPVVSSFEASECGLGVSFLERLFQFPLYQRNLDSFAEHGGYNPLVITKLTDNYRSHPAIITLPSNMFYHGELIAKADKEMIECLSRWHLLGNKDQFPMLFHGVRGEDLKEGSSPSSFNPQEVLVVIDYLMSLLESKKSYALSPDDIGIITPYRKQAQKIALMINSMNLPKVKVGSVEEFQGQEKMAVIISTVKSTENFAEDNLVFLMGFLSRPKRFNVAITRAHALLIVVGNPFVLCQDAHWRRLLKYCVMNDAYVGCSLPELGDEEDDDFFKSLIPPNISDQREIDKNRRDNRNKVEKSDNGGGGVNINGEIKNRGGGDSGSRDGNAKDEGRKSIRGIGVKEKGGDSKIGISGGDGENNDVFEVKKDDDVKVAKGYRVNDKEFGGGDCGDKRNSVLIDGVGQVKNLNIGDEDVVGEDVPDESFNKDKEGGEVLWSDMVDEKLNDELKKSHENNEKFTVDKDDKDNDVNNENKADVMVGEVTNFTNTDGVKGAVEFGGGDNEFRHGCYDAKSNDDGVSRSGEGSRRNVSSSCDGDGGGGIKDDGGNSVSGGGGGVSDDGGSSGGGRYKKTNADLNDTDETNVADDGSCNGGKRGREGSLSDVVDKYLHNALTRSFKNNGKCVVDQYNTESFHSGVGGTGGVKGEVCTSRKGDFACDLENNEGSALHCNGGKAEENNSKNNSNNNNKRKNKKKKEVDGVMENTDLNSPIKTTSATSKDAPTAVSYDFRNFMAKSPTPSPSRRKNDVEMEQLKTKNQQPAAHKDEKHVDDKDQASLGDKQLNKKIIKQFEYYFGDFNLIRDHYLNMAADAAGWVGIDKIMHFKKMKSLKVEADVVLRVLNHHCNLLQVDVKGGRVRRKNAFKADLSLWYRRMVPKVVVVYGMDCGSDEVRETFEQFGEVIHVEMNIPCQQRRDEVERCHMVVFKSSSFAAKSTIMNSIRINQSSDSNHSNTKIAVFYNDQTVAEALHYFIDLKVHQLPKKELKPITLRI